MIWLNNALLFIFSTLIFSMFSEAISSSFKTLIPVINEKPLISLCLYLSILSLALVKPPIKRLIYNPIASILFFSVCCGFFINYFLNGFAEGEWWNFLYVLAYYLIYIIFVFLGRLIGDRNYAPKKKTQEEQEYPFLLDEPLDTKDESKISEDDLSKLKNKLLATKGISQSFVLGIIGAWGSGKTTLGKQLHDSLEKHSQKCSPIWFEPWKFKGENSVQDSLIEHLSSKLPAQSSVLKEYGDLLKHEAIPAFIKFFIDLVNHSSSEDKFEKLKESLKKHGKQIYIFIDDLDRLDAKEILEVFKLIRSTLSLPQLSYVLIYDKSHIESVLESSASQKNDSRNFLDKIVQVEYYMPSKGQMSDYYVKVFFSEFEKDDTLNSNPDATSNKNKFKVSAYEYQILEILKKNLEGNLEEESANFKRAFDAHIFTIRDLKRLINNFLITINTVRTDWQKEFEEAANNITDTKKYEVYFQFFLEILKTKYPEVYDRFYFKDPGLLIQPKSHHDELYNTDASQGEKEILDDKYKQSSTKTKLNQLLDIVFGRYVKEKLESKLRKDIGDYQDKKKRSLRDIEKKPMVIENDATYQLIYIEQRHIRLYNGGSSQQDIQANTYLLICAKPDGSFPDVPTGSSAEYGATYIDAYTNRLLGLRFEKFANENGFLCHTAHYKKYFGINKDQDKLSEEK